MEHSHITTHRPRVYELAKCRKAHEQHPIIAVVMSLMIMTFGCCGTWWRIGRVEAFRPEGRGFESRSRPQRRDLGQVLHSQLPMALRRETPAQYPCCVGSAS